MLKNYFQNYTPNIQKLFWNSFLQKTKKKYGWMEFKGIRDYVFGDNPKHIFWKSYAQNQRMTTKIFDDLELKPIHFYIFLSPSFIFDDAMIGKSKKKIIQGLKNKEYFSKLDFALSLIKENILRLYKDSYYNTQKIFLNILYEDNKKIKQWKQIAITKSTIASNFHWFTETVKNFYKQIHYNSEFDSSLEKVLDYIKKHKVGIETFSLFTDIVNFWNTLSIPKNINVFTFLTWFELNGIQNHWLKKFTEIVNFHWFTETVNQELFIDRNNDYYRNLQKEIEDIKQLFKKKKSNYFLIET